MKKILFLLLSTIAMYGQVPADATPLENIQITNNTQSTTATKVNVQENDGTINTISKSDLVNVVEVNDVPTLPLVGEVGKIYVVKNVNKIYRWNGTFYQELAGSDISGLQAQIDLKANDSDVVKLTGNQSITGTKTFNNSTSGTSVVANNTSTGTGLSAVNSSTGTGIYSYNTSTGDGIYSENIAGGVGLHLNNFSGGNNIVSNNSATGTGFNYVGQNQDINTFTVDKTGNVTATSFINSTAPANNILLAGGGDLAQNTAFNKNFGTTAGTVVEGGTLGSNAYSSTAYQPLLTNPVTGTGTTGYLPKFTSSSSVGNSLIFDNGTNVGIGTTSNVFYTNYTSLTIGDNNASRTGLLKLKSTYNSGDGFEMSQLPTGDVYFGLNSATPIQVIKANGNVLIGTTTDDGNKLRVNGTGYFDSSVTATSFNGSATLTGTPTAPTAPAGTNTTQIATTAFVQENARPYKVYTALLSQTGTNAPVATVLENTLGGTVVWSREAAGFYNATLAGAFTLNKTTVLITQGTGQAIYSVYGDASTNHVKLIGYSFAGIQLDNLLNKTTIEIRVYN